MDLKYFEHKDLLKCLKRLYRSGGQAQKAGEQVHAVRSKIIYGDTDLISPI